MEPQLTRKIKLFAGSHSPIQLESLSGLDEWIEPVLFTDLSFSGRYSHESLAENRFFQSDESLNCDAEFVGFVSARLLSRMPSLGNFRALHSVFQTLPESSFWAPNFTPIENRAQLRYWASLQDRGTPGMNNILRNVMEFRYPEKSSSGNVFLGNQFIVHIDAWRNFILQWRKSLERVIEIFGEDPGVSFRCLACGAHRPDGYFRYGPNRRLAFIGERLTSLHFAHQSLIPVRGTMQQEIQWTFPYLSSRGPTGALGALVNSLTNISKLSKRVNCDVCNVFDPEDPRSYGILNP